MKSRLGNLRLYKFDVPSESDVGVMVISYEDGHVCQRFRLTRYTGRRRGRGSKAGLSKSFVDLVDWSFMSQQESNISNQIFDYIVSNFSFKDLDIVPPACHVLVFHFQVRGFGQDHVPEIDITSLVLSTLRTRDSVLSVEDARTRLVPIAPPTTEIVDCYQRLLQLDKGKLLSQKHSFNSLDHNYSVFVELPTLLKLETGEKRSQQGTSILKGLSPKGEEVKVYESWSRNKGASKLFVRM
ncbi:unnamed protein product [Arabidopsis arenosa]|uniref:Uncharacterized protein n=1 Tax=Arabidopsis arenosa TaxID=38785 RepID=A0A8S1ZTP1_ARAAE|nr:unnamed protein product [Arabidopsis arenosa]